MHRLIRPTVASLAVVLASALAAPASAIVPPPSPLVSEPAVKAAGKTDPQWPADTTGKGCSSPVWPGGAAENDPRRVLVVGDSLTRESRPMLERTLSAKGWLPTVRCWGGKGTVWGVEQLKRARQLGQLPPTVVVALGTNDVWWLGTSLATGVDEVMKVLGPKRTVYWVNLRFGPNGYSDLPHHGGGNKVLREKDRQYRNMTVINFARQYGDALKSDPYVGWADGVHLNYRGYVVRSSIIAKALGEPRRG